MSIIIGIDPWTTTIGFAVLKKQNRQIEILDYGVFSTPPKLALWSKLLEIEKDIETLFKKYPPHVCVIEKLFFAKNTKTAIDVAHSRGVLICSIAKQGITLLEPTPMEVKKGICGNGNAPKKQVQNALKLIFSLNQIPTPDDAADALAMAYMGSAIDYKL